MPSGAVKVWEQVLQAQSELEQFSICVEKIYDAALDQNLWPTALKHISDLIGGDCGAIHFADMQKIEQGALSQHTYGLPISFVELGSEYAGIWALQSGLPSWEVGVVHHLPNILPRNEFLNGRFYKEVLSKFDQDDYIGMLAAKDGSRIAPLTLSTLTATGTFSERALKFVTLLSSHICKSAKITYALELKSLEATRLESILDALSSGIYLVQRDGRLVFMNKAAESQMKRGLGLQVLNSRVTTHNTSAAQQLSQAINSEYEAQSSPISIALPHENGGMIATVICLDKGNRQNLASNTNPAIFAIFVQNPEIAMPFPGEGFAKLYGLTPAELRITLTMAPGLGPQGAAEILGLSITTVKSHLQNVFAKTGTNRQGDLMQLLMRSSAPISA